MHPGGETGGHGIAPGRRSGRGSPSGTSSCRPSCLHLQRRAWHPRGATGRVHHGVMHGEQTPRDSHSIPLGPSRPNQGSPTRCKHGGGGALGRASDGGAHRKARCPRCRSCRRLAERIGRRRSSRSEHRPAKGKPDIKRIVVTQNAGRCPGEMPALAHPTLPQTKARRLELFANGLACAV